MTSVALSSPVFFLLLAGLIGIGGSALFVAASRAESLDVIEFDMEAGSWFVTSD